MRYLAIAILVLTLLLSLNVASATIEEAVITTGPGERSSSSTLNASFDVTGGNETSENITGTAVTSRWTGFYGNLSGNVVLGDATRSVFRAWNVHKFKDGVVYAANDSVGDWSSTNIQPATTTDLPGYLIQPATDNFTNTFTDTKTFSSASLNVKNTYYTRSLNNTRGESFYTYALKSTSDDALVFAGIAEDDANSFKGSTVDYQLIAPAQENTTYEFYLELP